MNVYDVRDYIPNIIQSEDITNKYSRNKIKKNEESKLSKEFNNYDNKNNNDIEIKNLKAAFKEQVKLFHNKCNNNDIFYGFKFAKGKKVENDKNIKSELNFDYSTPEIRNKYINKFSKNLKSMKNININIKLYNNYMQYSEYHNYSTKNYYKNKNRYETTYINNYENKKNMNLLYNKI